MPRGASHSDAARSTGASESEVSGSSNAVVGTESSSSMTRATRALSTFSTADVNKRVDSLVQFLLAADQRKQPIKRLDIIKNVLLEMSHGFAVIMEQARRKLIDVFGIRLIDVDGKQERFILANKFDMNFEDGHLEWSPEENAHSALVMIILSIIFMNGNTVVETTIWNALKILGISDASDPVFKDTKKLITQDFVKQGYLCYQVVPHTDPVEYQFTWGDRARHETTKMLVLEFVSQIYDNMAPKLWTQQYTDAMKQES